MASWDNAHLSLIERHPKGWTFFLFGKWYYMRHLKQRKEARYARNVGDGRSNGPGYLMYLGIKSMGRK